MRLNTLFPMNGSKHFSKRLCRGMGSGLGKTGGRGHKGQKSRSGSGIRHGFQGGQMPLYRRLPKFGFTSHKSIFTEEIRLSDLKYVESNMINIDTLKRANLIKRNIKYVKIIVSGEIDRVITVCGLRVSQGARMAIESLGGKIKEIDSQ